MRVAAWHKGGITRLPPRNPVRSFTCYHVASSDDLADSAGDSRLVVIKLLFLLVFMVVGASFAIINDAPVVVDLYFVTPQLPLSLLLLLAPGSALLLVASPAWSISCA